MSRSFSYTEGLSMEPHELKTALHELVDTLSEDELPTAHRFLAYLLHVSNNPVLRALLDAPLDDEPDTSEEQAAVQESLEQLARSETLSTSTLREGCNG
jgi:hypothetical protein